MQLRDYQAETIEKIYKYWDDNSGKWPLVVLPTGGGKTIVFGTLVKNLNRDAPGIRILILAHRQELITQAESKILNIWPEAPIGVYAAAVGRKEIRPVTVASRGTLVNALDFCGVYDLVIVDEAHNISSKESTQYQKIIEGLKAENPSLMVLGFTATPYRTGGGYIYKTGGRFDDSKLFDGIAHEVKIKTLIKAGYLCNVIASDTRKESNIDTAGIRTINGDFATKELEIAAERQGVIESALNEWERLSAGRMLTVFFCVSVHHAHMVSSMLADRGYIVPVISGKTPKKERDEILYKAERLQVHGVANVGVLTEGTDIPPIDCIAMLRPTKALGLYVQMVGRGLRLSPETGKKNCLLLDFGGCIDRFGPIDIAQPPDEKSKDPRTKKCPCCESILKFFARKCDQCGEEFSPAPHKLCPECGEENAPTAATCVACDHVFVSHNAKAGFGAILSEDEDPIEIKINKVTASIARQVSNGLPVIRITYSGGLMNYAYKTLMIGAPGMAGKVALFDWAQMMKDKTPIPRNIMEAQAILKSGDCLRPVWKVKIYPNDPQKEAKEIFYKKEYR